MQPENQSLNDSPAQPPPPNNGQGFLPVAHEQPMPQVDPVVGLDSSHVASEGATTTYVAPERFYPGQESYRTESPQPTTPSAAPTYISALPQQPYQDVESFGGGILPHAPVVAPSVPMPAVAPIGYTESPQPPRKKLFIIAGFLLCFVVGIAVGLFVPLPGIRSGGQLIGGHQASSLLAPVNFQYSILEDNTSLFLTWGRVEGASSYTLSYAKDEAFTKDVHAKENIKDDSMTLRGLKEGETYYLRVTAHNGNESSGPSGVLVVSLVD